MLEVGCFVAAGDRSAAVLAYRRALANLAELGLADDSLARLSRLLGVEPSRQPAEDVAPHVYGLCSMTVEGLADPILQAPFDAPDRHFVGADPATAQGLQGQGRGAGGPGRGADARAVGHG